MNKQQEGEQQPKQVNHNNDEAKVLEYGDIYFFYRPKVRSDEVKGIEDVRRFFMVTAPEESQLYRLFVIGKKSLPEVRKTEARASERYWARVGG
ncbi:MAG TPA: hypothetical protein VE223_02275, partial [Nitrososphaeraceae archaeon]|nr:hypothetical protein [Nitrososphaeraceae archaeon]